MRLRIKLVKDPFVRPWATITVLVNGIDTAAVLQYQESAYKGWHDVQIVREDANDLEPNES
jgi:hypothetical protein